MNIQKSWHTRQQVLNSQRDAEKDGIQVPTTVQEYCLKTTENSCKNIENSDNYTYDDDDNDFYNDDNDILDDDSSQESYKEYSSQDESEEIAAEHPE